MELLARRVVVVTGKGGVGKSLVSALLAVRAARAGKRVAVCETNGMMRAASLLGLGTSGYAPAATPAGPWACSITSHASLEDYLTRVLRYKAVYEAVFRNRVMGPFMDAVPGLHDMIQLGRVWDLERERLDDRPAWDLLVVDAPATGHGLGMLDSPRAMMDMTVAGPFHDNAGLIASLFEDPARTALLLVATPEDMPVRETLDLWERLGTSRERVRGVVLNRVESPPVPDAAAWPSVRAALTEGATPAGRRVLEEVDARLARRSAALHARARLAPLGLPIVELPELSAGPRTADLAALADALGLA
jgi:anion-transporting  ArsA/GET3 family ATPase